MRYHTPCKLVGRNEFDDLQQSAILQKYNILPDDEPPHLVRSADKMYVYVCCMGGYSTV